MAIDFSQVRALQIQNEAYRQLEYIKLGNNNYFDLGTTSQGLYLEFDINVSVPLGATAYDFYGYNVNGYGKSVNEVTIMRSGASFTYGRRNDTTVALAQIYDGPLMHNKRRIVKSYVRDDKKSVIEIYDTDGTLLDSSTSVNVYVNKPYAIEHTGLFAQWEYRSSDGETKFRPCIELGQSGIFYSYKVRASADGPLVENWLPAQRKADGAIGIYDTVNHRFLQPHITTNTTYYTYLEGGPVFDENPQWSPLVKVKQIKNANNVVLWTAAPELTSITLAGYNTSLNINSNFLYGGTVTANYSDGSTADVTLATTFSGYDMSTAGTQTVTASYSEHGITKTATYQLTIVAENWVTLWEGTQTITRSSSGQSGSTSEFAQSQANTGSTPTLRITFEMTDITPSTDVYYVVNGTNTSTKPNSPISATFSNITPLAVRGGQYEVRMYMFSRSSSNNVYFMLYSAAYSSGATTSVTLTIKKIEQLIE